ncbi:GNAT family N-acetyltransferase [Flavobacterium crassostreae]|uniref:GCN5 family acetyltransferase n=1 Tax=Flavobacterium crassostreae TaxID=1763534 RepID=A0A1B9EA28_9FLAO|nr:GNAT family N-acetyltransferase [Flavobacterium crassostreae]OCB78792.1 GCN5 family acetyltransferase [Flavobacterium crassostreae]
MITPANPNDSLALNCLINAAYRGETAKQGWTTEAYILKGNRTTPEELNQILSNPIHTLLKYTQNNQILGCVLVTQKDHQLYLGMLTVSPSFQNKGLGKQLLQAAEQHARALGLNTIEMTVISVREELLAWYQRHGYVATGAREAFPNPTDSIDQKPLEFVFLEKKIC